MHKEPYAFLFLLSYLVAATTSTTNITCHYSCSECAGDFYTLCLGCSDSQNTLVVVEDPQKANQKFINSLSVTGVCEGKVPEGANGFGIIMLILCIGVAIVIRTKQIMYLISTLQNLALLSFIEIPWMNPANYLLQSLQYYMFFNPIMWERKSDEDFTMKQRQFYRLGQYFRGSQFLTNISFIGLVSLLIYLGMIGIAIWKQRNKKQIKKRLKQQREREKLAEDKIIDNISQKSEKQAPLDPQSYQNLNSKERVIYVIFYVLQTLFYFFILETSLTIMVGLRFPPQVQISTIIIAILYALMLLLYLIYCWFYPIWFFPNIPSQLVNVWRKIGMPVIVIVPPQYHFLIIVFMIIFMIGQSIFDYKGGDFKLKSRITLYKALQFVIIILSIAYYLTETGQNQMASSSVIRVFFSIFILGFYICIIVELVFGIYERYFSQNKVQNSEKNTEQRFANINETQNNIGDSKIHEQNTLGLINLNDKEDNNKNKLQIFDIQDEDDDANRKDNKDNRKNNRGDIDSDLDKNKNKDTLSESRNLKGNKGIQHNLNKSNKSGDEQNRKNLNHDQHDDGKGNRNPNKNGSDDEDQERKRRKKKEEQQQEIKPRKKKAYKGQLDPELRKRYGF